jgi:hypothetical protein
LIATRTSVIFRHCLLKIILVKTGYSPETMVT